MKRFAIVCIVALAVLCFTPAMFAQDELNHVEIGIYGDLLRPQNFNLNLLGLGGRAAFNVHPHVQLEAQMAYDFEKNFTTTITAPTTTTTRSGLRALHGEFGPKFQTSGPIRAFVTIKGGFIRFMSTNAPATFGTFTSTVAGTNTTNSFFTLYPAGGAEFFAGPIGLRVEVGDTIFFNNGAHNSLSVSFGPQLRF